MTNPLPETQGTFAYENWKARRRHKAKDRKERRRPSQIFLNGTGTIAYLPHDVDDARFIGLAATAATAAARSSRDTGHI